MRLILTASVIANAPVARCDHATRRHDYQSALMMWLAFGPFTEVYVVEGSATPYVEPEHRRVAARRDILLRDACFDVSELSRTRGKGRAEAELLRVGRMGLMGDDCFAKCSGRYYVSNARAVSAPTPTGRASVHDTAGVDTRFFVARAGWFDQYVEPHTEEIDDARSQTYIEYVYGRAAVWETFELAPAIHGVPAGNAR